MEITRPQGWIDWYRFARRTLGLAHTEAVQYAHARFLEEQNRTLLRERWRRAA